MARSTVLRVISAVLTTTVSLGLGAGTALAQVPPPVDGVIVDSFRPPDHVGAPGNRGWEYATADGSPVRAVLAGVVAFAGPVAGTLHVSVDHAGGLRTTYSFLASIGVSAGDPVAAGTVLGATAERFHFGLRRGATYLDPAILFGPGPGGPARLVPRPGRVPPRPTNPLGVLALTGGSPRAIPLHSDGGSSRDHPTLSPWATHGRRVSGVGPGIR